MDRPAVYAVLATGLLGDVLPLVELAGQLAAQDHGPTVRVFSHASLQPWFAEVCRTGLDFVELEGDPGALMRDLKLVGALFDGRTIEFSSQVSENEAEALASTLAQVTEHFDGVEAIVTCLALCSIGQSMAQRLQLPLACVQVTPGFATGEWPHPYVSIEKLPFAWLNLLSYSLAYSVRWGALSRDVNAWREESLSLPPVPEFTPDVPTLVAVDEAVVPRASDWPAYVACGGFIAQPQIPPQLQEEGRLKTLAAFLERHQKTPPLYVGFGSMLLPEPMELVGRIMDAVKGLEVAVVFQGDESNLSGCLPAQDDSVLLLDTYVDHSWLFAQCSGAVHHGGAGTTAAVLRAGIPQLPLPMLPEQRWWAARAHTLGVCPEEPIRLCDVTTEWLSQALPTLLRAESDCTEAAREVAAQIAAQGRQDEQDDTNGRLHWLHEQLEAQQEKRGKNGCAWQRDEDVTRCPICRVDFGLLVRKHHCRACGAVVCDDHSQGRVKGLPGYPASGEQRVCDGCVG